MEDIQKEPALSSTHRLLVQSWFPEDVEVSTGVAALAGLSDPSSRDDIHKTGAADPSSILELPAFKENDRGYPSDHDNCEVRQFSARFRGYCASPKHYASTGLHTTVVGTARSLARWIRILYGKLQSMRTEAVAFVCISLLLLAREGFRHCSAYRLADVKLAVLALLTGIFLSSWINPSAN